MSVFSKFFLTAAVAGSVVALPTARAEVVFEDEIRDDSVAGAQEREATRQVIDASRKAEMAAPVRVMPAPQAPAAQVAVVQPQPVAPAPIQAPAAAVQPVVVMSQPETVVEAPAASAPQADVQHLSRGEMMRRARMREELRNEDALQERLEQLRLRDEKRRVEQVVGAAPAAEGLAAQAPVPTGAAAMKTEVVGSMAVQQPVEIVQNAPGGAQAAPVAGDRIASSAAAAQSVTSGAAIEGASEEKTRISVMPRAGLSTMPGTQLFNIQSRYSAGLSLGVGVSEYVGFEVGYLYSDFGVGVASSNAWVNQVQFANGSAFTGNFATYSLKQNVFDATLKLFLLGRDSKLRPYLGGGGGYSRSFLNYDPSILNVLNQFGYQGLTSDYETSQFLGILTAGFDVNVNKSVTIGAAFRYNTVLSSVENSALNPYAFYIGDPDPAKTVLGGSLARTNFYSILGTASFSF